MSLHETRRAGEPVEALVLEDDDTFQTEDFTAHQVRAWFDGDADIAKDMQEELENALDNAQAYARQHGKPAYIVITVNPP